MDYLIRWGRFYLRSENENWLWLGKVARTLLIWIIKEYSNNYQILLSFIKDLKGIINYLKTILRVKSDSKVKM